MKIENEHTFKQALSRGLNLFLGAGFSLLAADIRGRALPTGNRLRDELMERFDLQVESLDLAKISTVLEATKPAEFRKFIENRFRVGEFSKKYFSLFRLKIKNIFTTNVDDLLQRIYESSSENYLNDLDINGPQDRVREAINFIALHGSIMNQEKRITFGSRDLASAFSVDRDRWYALTNRLQTHPTLFWGSSMQDSGTLEAINPETIKGRDHKEKWIVIPEASEHTGTVQYFAAMGFQIIDATTEELLDFIATAELPSLELVKEHRKLATRDLFPYEAIPEPGTTPVRPLLEFYQGAPPSWYDIFHGRLHRTKHFGSVLDSIHSDRHTIILGLAACGKTTLMMQVAAAIDDYPGHKLVMESPLIESAQLIVNKLGKQKALIFVDNFTDSIDAFDLLTRHPNIKLVGADRDYNFDIISHRINHDKFTIIAITELDQYDVQKIIGLIPDSAKSESSVVPLTEEGQSPSLFEIMETSLNMPSLRERFRTVIIQIEKQSSNLLDFLLMCCYVHRCHTPISMDMLLAYFGSYINNYTEIYDMRDQLSSMVAEYIGELDDERQDYFIPRSIHVSEAIIDNAPSFALNRMITRFHKEVSRYRIHRFDIFRRRAFDKDIMLRAFTQFDEGKAFYESAFENNPSPYVLQQGALYLAHKNRFDEAFHWIDDALNQTRGEVWSIRNSHAIILFMANIGRSADDETVRRTLKQSMTILSDCYRSDKRKTYHAIKFAEQALQYHEIYADDHDSMEYLETARSWLKEVLINLPWHRTIKRLIRRVDQKIK